MGGQDAKGGCVGNTPTRQYRSVKTALSIIGPLVVHLNKAKDARCARFLQIRHFQPRKGQRPIND